MKQKIDRKKGNGKRERPRIEAFDVVCVSVCVCEILYVSLRFSSICRISLYAMHMWKQLRNSFHIRDFWGQMPHFSEPWKTEWRRKEKTNKSRKSIRNNDTLHL